MKSSKLSLAIVAGAMLLLPSTSNSEERKSYVFDEITVTGTREAQKKEETPATVGTVSKDTIKKVKPTHPSQIMGQVPGVWVNVTGGEGHQTAIRQPLTTNPVYLYLEDGIPVRSTGFFNHNALYEVNIPMADRIEVTKGPGSALYGTDSVGGVVNIITSPAPLTPEATITGEAGSFGWKRLMMSGGNTIGDHSLRTDLNITHTDGWRERTGYDRQGGTVRLDSMLSDTSSLKTVVSFSNINQQTAGSSTISYAHYVNDPKLNYTPISLRKVGALRISTAYEKEFAGGGLFSATPFFRDNTMTLLANWSLGYDPTIYITKNQSFGLLLKYRQDLEASRTRIIGGVDIDYSPGSRDEKSINTTKSGVVYTNYTEGQRIYDYNVTFRGVSPYLHTEMSPTEKLRLTAGLRYDMLGYVYKNNLSDANTVIKPSNIAFNITYVHPGSTTKNYQHVSPKLGATYTFAKELNLFVAYNHAFRVPSEGQLFRPASAVTDSVGLKPVKVDSYETGIRGNIEDRVSYEISLYNMLKKDDILSYTTSTGARQIVNAGKTSHRGVEFGLGVALMDGLKLNFAGSYAKHVYEQWSIGGATPISYDKKEMDLAPQVMTNTSLSYSPSLLDGAHVGVEWTKLGAYWMDPANTQKYKGHNLVNLRGSYPFLKAFEAFASVTNIQDVRYAESATATTTNVYAPGNPRAFSLGLTYNWK